MNYIFLLSWLIILWLGSAWTEGLIGIWGMYTAIGIAFIWLVIICAAKVLNKRESKR